MIEPIRPNSEMVRRSMLALSVPPAVAGGLRRGSAQLDQYLQLNYLMSS